MMKHFKQHREETNSSQENFSDGVSAYILEKNIRVFPRQVLLDDDSSTKQTTIPEDFRMVRRTTFCSFPLSLHQISAVIHLTETCNSPRRRVAAQGEEQSDGRSLQRTSAKHDGASTPGAVSVARRLVRATDTHTHSSPRLGRDGKPAVDAAAATKAATKSQGQKDDDDGGVAGLYLFVCSPAPQPSPLPFSFHCLIADGFFLDARRLRVFRLFSGGEDLCAAWQQRQPPPPATFSACVVFLERAVSSSRPPGSFRFSFRLAAHSGEPPLLRQPLLSHPFLLCRFTHFCSSPPSPLRLFSLVTF